MRKQLVLLAALFFGHASLAYAEFPDRPIRLVVNFAPGGTSDVIARALQQPLAEILGQPVVVENRPGASGALGAAEVARAAPDGYTLLLGSTGAIAQVPLLKTSTPYDPVKSFTPVTLLATTPYALLAHPDLPATSFPEFLAHARTNLERGLDVAVGGATIELAVASLAHETDINLVRVKYRGTAPSVTAVLGGEVKLTLITPSPTMSEYLRGGKLKLLGVTSAEPTPLLPEGVPIGESVPGFAVEAWFGILAPAGTPADVVVRLDDAFTRAASEQGMRERFANFGAALAPKPSSEFAQRIASDVEATRSILANTTIQID